jgi:NADH:ubiquinone reductase (non-electrogenic)
MMTGAVGATPQGVVKEVTATEVQLTDGTQLPYGLLIWSTGVGPTPFTLSLPVARTSKAPL